MTLGTDNGMPEQYRSKGYKKNFMLNSAEHEILNACMYKNIKKFFRLR